MSMKERLVERSSLSLASDTEGRNNDIPLYKKIRKYQWCAMICIVLGCVTYALTFFFVIRRLHYLIKTADQTCQTSDRGADAYANPASQELYTYFYNVTNPFEVVDGQQAKLYELGPYGITVTSKRGNVVYNDIDDTVSSYLWYE